jgi:hypothetical protein
MISYIIYIIGIIITIICFFTYTIKKYYTNICSFVNAFKSDDKIKILKRVEIIKDKYNIKSTEKTKTKTKTNTNTNTNIDLKFIVNKPTHLKTNKINNIDKKITIQINGELKNLLNSKYNKNIIYSYIYNKKIFTNLFLNQDNTYKINNLESFNIYHNKNLNNEINSNILLKFYNTNEYLYIFVNNDNLIKIINNDEYDYMTNLIENKNNIFLIEENKDNENKINYITHSGYIECDIDKEKITKIFFNNSKKLNKNFNLLAKFTYLKIFFYVSTQIDQID